MQHHPSAPVKLTASKPADTIFLPGSYVVGGCPFVPKRESFRVDNMRVSGETPLEWSDGGKRSCFFSEQFKGFGGETAAEPHQCPPLHGSKTHRAD
jgi:hypothetical protein